MAPPGPMAPPPGGPGPMAGPGAMAPPPPQQPRRPGGRQAAAALVLAVLLTIGMGIQTWQLIRVSNDLDEANDQLAELGEGQTSAGNRLDTLEGRASALEDVTGEAFDPEAVAEAVVPSVFLVTAGDFIGTAFAVGPEPDGGGTHLFTNYHVVEALWLEDGREVGLDRENQHYTGTILDVDPRNDVALLHTEESFDGLAASTEEVRVGQQIIAVGAPRGLSLSATTGVVSSPSQRLADGSGPWIQFDAAINPGNSGGPVVDRDEQVVGIATAGFPDSDGLGFAVPIGVACESFEVC